MLLQGDKGSGLIERSKGTSRIVGILNEDVDNMDGFPNVFLDVRFYVQFIKSELSLTRKC